VLTGGQATSASPARVTRIARCADLALLSPSLMTRAIDARVVARRSKIEISN